MAEQIDTRPEFKEAHCGRRPDAKPDDFTGTPVDVEVAETVYARELREHNERVGRRTEVCRGKLSFEQAFKESYSHRIRRVITEAQRMYFMCDMVYLKPNRNTGALTSKGFTWWSHEHQDTLLKHKRGKAQVKKAEKRALRGRNLMTAAELAAIQKRVDEAKPPPTSPAASNNLTGALFGVPGAKAKTAPNAEKTEVADLERQQEEFNANFRRGMEMLIAARMAG